MRHTRGLVPIATAVILAALGGSHATIITFHGLGHGTYVPNHYASRVVASDADLGFLQGDGWTPNISVETGSLRWVTHTLRPGTIMQVGSRLWESLDGWHS